MQLINEINFVQGKCRPLTITKIDRDLGPRIGGNAPVNVKPEKLRKEGSEYLLTIPWFHKNELSLFIWLSPIASDVNSSWTNCRKIHGSNSPFVQMVVHPHSVRSRDKQLASSIPAHRLRVGSAIKDLNPHDPESKWPGSKLGGDVYFEDAGSYAYALTNEITSAGYVHILQLTFPGNADTLLDVNWPFGLMIFHLFVKIVGETTEFKYIWA